MNGQKEVDYKKEKMKSRIAWGIAILFACIWLVITLVPFFFMIMNSFRKQFDSKSGLSTLAIYNGVSMWNEFAGIGTMRSSRCTRERSI